MSTVGTLTHSLCPGVQVVKSVRVTRPRRPSSSRLTASAPPLLGHAAAAMSHARTAISPVASAGASPGRARAACWAALWHVTPEALALTGAGGGTCPATMSRSGVMAALPSAAAPAAGLAGAVTWGVVGPSAVGVGAPASASATAGVAEHPWRLLRGGVTSRSLPMLRSSCCTCAVESLDSTCLGPLQRRTGVARTVRQAQHAARWQRAVFVGGSAQPLEMPLTA